MKKKKNKDPSRGGNWGIIILYKCMNNNRKNIVVEVNRPYV